MIGLKREEEEKDSQDEEHKEGVSEAADQAKRGRGPSRCGY